MATKFTVLAQNPNGKLDVQSSIFSRAFIGSSIMDVDCWRRIFRSIRVYLLYVGGRIVVGGLPAILVDFCIFYFRLNAIYRHIRRIDYLVYVYF